MDNTEKCEPPLRGESTLLRQVLLLFLKTSLGLLAVLAVFTFVYGLHRSADASMSPAILDGDLLLYYRLDKSYSAGEALLLTYDGELQVRRVVATAGDTVDITESGLVVNGALQQEAGIFQPTERYVQGVAFPLTVGEGQVFVLADARENAVDSRIYGPIDINATQGKILTILWRRNV